jgi:hypothetical protein
MALYLPLSCSLSLMAVTSRTRTDYLSESLMAVTSRTRTDYLSESPKFTYGFGVGFVFLFLQFSVLCFTDNCFFVFLLFFFRLLIICPWIYCFQLYGVCNYILCIVLYDTE